MGDLYGTSWKDALLLQLWLASMQNVICIRLFIYKLLGFLSMNVFYMHRVYRYNYYDTKEMDTIGVCHHSYVSAW